MVARLPGETCQNLIAGASVSSRHKTGPAAQPGMESHLSAMLRRLTHAEVDGAGDASSRQHPPAGNGLGQAAAIPRHIPRHGSHRPPDPPGGFLMRGGRRLGACGSQVAQHRRQPAEGKAQGKNPGPGQGAQRFKQQQSIRLRSGHESPHRGCGDGVGMFHTDSRWTKGQGWMRGISPAKMGPGKSRASPDHDSLSHAGSVVVAAGKTMLVSARVHEFPARIRRLSTTPQASPAAIVVASRGFPPGLPACRRRSITRSRRIRPEASRGGLTRGFPTTLIEPDGIA